LPTLHREHLPNGLDIWALTRFESLLLYQELIAESPYHKHGIEVDGRSTVYDIGANIGVYAIAVSRAFPGVRVRCFEPVPILFDALTRNLSEHAPAATARQIGLSSRPGDAMIAFDPYGSVASSVYPDVFQKGSDPRTSKTRWAQAALVDLDRVQPSAGGRALLSGLSRPATWPLAMAALTCLAVPLGIRSALYRQHISVTLDTLSSILKDEETAVVDLVKIDVEGAELDVLAGMTRMLRHPALRLLVEWHPRLQEAAGYPPDALPRALVDHGFRLDTASHLRMAPLPPRAIDRLAARLHFAGRPVEILARR